MAAYIRFQDATETAMQVSEKRSRVVVFEKVDAEPVAPRCVTTIRDNLVVSMPTGSRMKVP